MSYRGKVHDLLRIGFGKHCESGLTAGVNVGMIAENVERVRCYATGGYMKDRREKLSGNFIHVGDHKQKPLGSCISCSKSAGRERTVYRTCGACLRLHFHNLYGCSEDVFHTGGSPLIDIVSHRA